MVALEVDQQIMLELWNFFYVSDVRKHCIAWENKRGNIPYNIPTVTYPVTSNALLLKQYKVLTIEVVQIHTCGIYGADKLH